MKFSGWLHYFYLKFVKCFSPLHILLPFSNILHCVFFLDKSLLHLFCRYSKEGLCFQGEAVDPQEKDSIAKQDMVLHWELQMLLSQTQNRAWRKVKNAVIPRNEGDVALSQQALQIHAGLQPTSPFLPSATRTQAYSLQFILIFLTLNCC